MADIDLMPLAGMNNVSEDDALHKKGRKGESSLLFARDIVNIDVSPTGKATLRSGMRRVSAQPIRSLWQSPLHKDTFAVVGTDWGKVDTDTWTHDPLTDIGNGPVSHEVLNSLVCFAGSAGIFTFNGIKVQRLTIEQPAAPLVITTSGSMPAGTYGVAVAWLRESAESAPSAITFTEVEDDGGINVTLPMSLDPEVTGARLYLTKQSGGELMRVGDYPISTGTISLPSTPSLGATPPFLNKSAMPTGLFLKYWRGRLLTASANVLRFSDALAYHIHDERYGFVQMPQRITFVEPVDEGVWVGQVDHVAFLQGSAPDNLSINRKAVAAPVPFSSMRVDSSVVGGDISQGGGTSAIWLSENGYVAGTPNGQLFELQSSHLKGITGNSGSSVVMDQRLYTAVI